MLFKLSLKNIKASYKDYAIYFVTLILGVGIFYTFNAIDSQTSVMLLSDSQLEIIQLMMSILDIVSAFVAIVLGFLVLYANNFLIRRRKKEFGIYLTLGLGKNDVSKILIIETLFIGIISLVLGIVIGSFASQLMSIFAAKMFEADLSAFKFIFSSSAAIKTIIYFSLMFLVVMIFNVFNISRFNLIDLLNGEKKSEKLRVRNPYISVLFFIISIGILFYAYNDVMVAFETMNISGVYKNIALGIIGTYMFFYFLAGFLLKLIQSNERFYYRNLNVFVLRQINSSINSIVGSLSVICILLFLTICILSSGLSINDSIRSELIELTPVDANFTFFSEREEDKIKASEVFDLYNYDYQNKLSEYVELNTYTSEDVTIDVIIGEKIYNEIISSNPMLSYNHERIKYMFVGDYNKLAKMYHLSEVDLAKNEYTILCDFETMCNYYNQGMKEVKEISVNGTKLTLGSEKTVNGFVEITSNRINDGIVLIGDNSIVADMRPNELLIAANYSESYKNAINSGQVEEGAFYNKDGVGYLDFMSKNVVYENAIGLSTMMVFIGLYLGIIFLIASVAILALKQLSDSSDNKKRYSMLRKIGVDEVMINHALAIQIGIFFLLPLLLACVHSIFGIRVAKFILRTFATKEAGGSILITAAVIVIVYGGYYVLTIMGSKNIIKDDH